MPPLTELRFVFAQRSGNRHVIRVDDGARDPGRGGRHDDAQVADLARRSRDLQASPPGVRGREFQRVGPRLEVDGEGTIRGHRAEAARTAVGHRARGLQGTAGRRCLAVRRDVHTLHREGRLQPQQQGLLGRAAGAFGDLELSMQVALGEDHDAAAESGRDARDAVLVGSHPFTVAQPDGSAGNRRSSGRIDDPDPGDVGRHQDDGAQIHGILKVEAPGELQVAAVRLQGHRALREPAEQEPAVRAGDTRELLHHRNHARHPGKPLEPRSRDRLPLRIDRLAAHGETRTQFDDRRHLGEALESSRRPARAGNDDRRAFCLGQSQRETARLVRHLESKRLRRQTRAPSTAVPREPDSRAGQGGTVRGYPAGEPDGRPQLEFHGVLVDRRVPPGRGEPLGTRLNAKRFTVSRQRQGVGHRSRRRQKVPGHLVPHGRRRRGHLEFGRRVLYGSGLVGEAPRSVKTDRQPRERVAGRAASGSRVLPGAKEPRRTGVAPGPAVGRRTDSLNVCATFPRLIRRHHEGTDGNPARFTLPRTYELKRVTGSRFVLSRRRSGSKPERDPEKADRRSHRPSLLTRPVVECGLRTRRPPARRLPAGHRRGAGSPPGLLADRPEGECPRTSTRSRTVAWSRCGDHRPGRGPGPSTPCRSAGAPRR